MDCHKDEAIKAVESAEEKFLERDFTGAKRFALKAQNLYPGLDGLPQMVATIDVYIHSENKVCGEVDWYGILGVNPWDNEDTLRKQYRKLVLMLHPDENKSIGAEGAFKFISNAWKLLSVPSQREAYNQKRNARAFQPGTQKSMSSPSGPSPENGIHIHESKRLNAKARTRKDTTGADNGAYGTFWTICNNCKTHYEYQRCYLNHNLLCPNCRQVFIAIERAPPQHVFKSSRSPSAQEAASTSSTAQGAGRLNQVNREENHAKKEIGCFASQEETPMKRTKVGNHSTHGTGSFENVNELERSVLSSVERGLAFPQINFLMKKARAEIHKKLNEWTSEAKVVMRGVDVKGREASSEMFTMDVKSKVQPGSSGASMADNSSLSIDVPDSDFHNFDLDRSENSFDVDQVWAAYDDTDGMPRFYARIHKVISLDPFKIKLSWLDSENDDEFGRSAWVSSGIYKACGDFKAGKPESCDKLNGFSHKVVWLESAVGLGTIRIVPSKGKTWALYRNWSLEWNEDTPDDIVQKYEIVEILDDYTEERGIPVSPLLKVPGFRSVFRPCEDLKKVMLIHKEEMTRLSHQVPSHLLTGEEAPNLRHGFRELDPAALPEELLQEYKEKKADAEDSRWVNEVVWEDELKKSNADDNRHANVAVQNREVKNKREDAEDINWADEVKPQGSHFPG